MIRSIVIPARIRTLQSNIGGFFLPKVSILLRYFFTIASNQKRKIIVPYKAIFTAQASLSITTRYIWMQLRRKRNQSHISEHLRAYSLLKLLETNRHSELGLGVRQLSASSTCAFAFSNLSSSVMFLTISLVFLMIFYYSLVEKFSLLSSYPYNYSFEMVECRFMYSIIISLYYKLMTVAKSFDVHYLCKGNRRSTQQMGLPINLPPISHRVVLLLMPLCYQSELIVENLFYLVSEVFSIRLEHV